MGAITGSVCDMNEPSECEVLGLMAEIDLDSTTNCMTCFLDSYGETSSGGVVASGSGSASSSTGSRSVFWECGAYEDEIPVNSCEDLRTAIEEDGGYCRFHLPNDITCDASVTVASGQDIVISGLSGDHFSWIEAVSPFGSPSPAEFYAGASMFIVEDGARLTLESLGFNATGSQPVRLVHNYGDVVISSCTLAGGGSSSLDYGGAVRHPPVRVVPPRPPAPLSQPGEPCVYSSASLWSWRGGVMPPLGVHITREGIAAALADATARAGRGAGPLI